MTVARCRLARPHLISAMTTRSQATTLPAPTFQRAAALAMVEWISKGSVTAASVAKASEISFPEEVLKAQT